MTDDSGKGPLARWWGRRNRGRKAVSLDDSVKAPAAIIDNAHAPAPVARAPVSNASAPAPVAGSLQDFGHLLDSLPAIDDLDALNERVAAIAQASATQRKAGDALVADDMATVVAAAASAKWELALALNTKAIEVVRSYKDYEWMFDQTGRPLPGAAKSNYPLKGGEQRLARQFCDLIGREGGLLRRLERGAEASKAYSIGAEIEKAGDNFGIANSYCTMNDIAIQIELGRRRATPSSEVPPDLATSIAAARAMIQAQFDQGRDRDIWAKADLGMSYVLSGDTGDNRSKAQDLYYDYAVGAFPLDFNTTLRILRRVEAQLRTMRDPAADMVAWAIKYVDEVRAVKLEELRGG